MGHARQAWSPRVFLSLSFFLFRLIPWSAGALCIHFPAWASKTHSRRCLRWGTFSYLRGACSLCEQSKSHAGVLLAFCVNQGISASFLSSIFLTTKFFPYLFSIFLSRRCHPPKGIPGSNRGWTPVHTHMYIHLLVLEFPLSRLSLNGISCTDFLRMVFFSCY